jgi:hypothetical protein
MLTKYNSGDHLEEDEIGGARAMYAERKEKLTCDFGVET